MAVHFLEAKEDQDRVSQWQGRRENPREREEYGYKLACVIDGGLLLDLSYEGSFGIGGGAEGGV